MNTESKPEMVLAGWKFRDDGENILVTGPDNSGCYCSDKDKPIAGVVLYRLAKALLAAAPASPPMPAVFPEEALQVRRAARELIIAMCNGEVPVVEPCWLPSIDAPNRQRANMWATNPPKEVIDAVATAQSKLILALDRWNPEGNTK
jgi:hypothetical protein